MKHGKKYIESAKLIESSKLYDPDEAVHCIFVVIWACKKPPAFGRGLNFREREIT